MHCLLVNPWIYDFAAFDLWQKPLGLLYMGAVLRDHGWSIELLDCLDRYDRELLLLHKPKDKKYYTGKYIKHTLEKPKNLAHIPRKYGRYGLPESVIRGKLRSAEKPDVIFMTSGMTYWYPALVDLIAVIREYFPVTPVILGGTYATLAPEHARKHIPADIIVPGEGENRLAEILPENMHGDTDFKVYNSLDDIPFPALDLYDRVHYLPLLTTRGCPLRCSFCASYKLSGRFRKRSVDSVLDEILYGVRKYSIRDVVFYDDALLSDKKEHILPILDKILSLDLSLRFHTPNGLQAGAIDAVTAKKMVQSGFKTVRLSLETISGDRQKDICRKVTPDGFCSAVDAFDAAGFPRNQIEAYILIGLPEQDVLEVLETIFFAAELGVITRLAEFSPIPGTKDWERLLKSGVISGSIDLTETNNTVFIHKFPEYSVEVVNEIKNLIKCLNNCVKSCAPLPHKDKTIDAILSLQKKQLKNAMCWT